MPSRGGPSARLVIDEERAVAVSDEVTEMEQKKRIWVAVGVIENERGEIFIAKRSSDTIRLHSLMNLNR